MAIKIDLRVPPCAPVADVTRFVSRCEEAGFDGVGILDSQMLERDVFVAMALAAQATSRIRISSAVLNPVTRHVSVLASAIKTVSETAPGRCEFWIGRGFSSVQTIGIPPATVRQMRRCVQILKSLLLGENVTFNGNTGIGATSRMRHGDAQLPRIFIAAHGPRTIEVAGEVADGVLLQVGLHPQAVELARQHLEAGARRAGRDPEELEIILCATTIISDDQQEARELARPLCVQRLVEKTHAPYLQAAGIEAGDLDIPPELSELYPDIPHAEDWEKARRLCSFLPDEILAQMCDAMGLIGTPEYCTQQLRRAEAQGIDHLYLMTGESYQFPERELQAFQQTIFPAMRRA